VTSHACKHGSCECWTSTNPSHLRLLLTTGLPSWQRDWTVLIVSFLISHFNFLFVTCGGLSWLPVSFLLHVKYTLSYRIVSYQRLIKLYKLKKSWTVDRIIVEFPDYSIWDALQHIVASVCAKKNESRSRNIDYLYSVVSLLQWNLACDILMALDIKRIRNLSPHLSYVSTLPDSLTHSLLRLTSWGS